MVYKLKCVFKFLNLKVVILFFLKKKMKYLIEQIKFKKGVGTW